MKNIQLFKHIAAGLLLSGSLIGTSCSSDYMDTIPTENVFFFDSIHFARQSLSCTERYSS